MPWRRGRRKIVFMHFWCLKSESNTKAALLRTQLLKLIYFVWNMGMCSGNQEQSTWTSNHAERKESAVHCTIITLTVNQYKGKSGQKVLKTARSSLSTYGSETEELPFCAAVWRTVSKSKNQSNIWKSQQHQKLVPQTSKTKGTEQETASPWQEWLASSISKGPKLSM